MNIVNIIGQDVKACCKFKYKKAEISISTILKNSLVGVFFENGVEVYFQSVENAIKYIDERDERNNVK